MIDHRGRHSSPGNLGAVEVVDGPEHCTPPVGGSAVTIGAYDGVHLGHRHLLAELRRQAAGADSSPPWS